MVVPKTLLKTFREVFFMATAVELKKGNVKKKGSSVSVGLHFFSVFLYRCSEGTLHGQPLFYWPLFLLQGLVI